MGVCSLFRITRIKRKNFKSFEMCNYRYAHESQNALLIRQEKHSTSNKEN